MIKTPDIHQLQRGLLNNELESSSINPSVLSTFQKIILTTDGTLTELLEIYLHEKLKIIKLGEEIFPAEEDIAALEIKTGHEIMRRRILLRGKISHSNWIYAESLIVPDRLDEVFRERLINSQEPMGRLWLERRIETFKEIIDTEKQIAGNLSQYFQLKPEEKLLSRTYRVFSNQQVIMMITEKFPESYFR